MRNELRALCPINRRPSSARRSPPCDPSLTRCGAAASTPAAVVVNDRTPRRVSIPRYALSICVLLLIAGTTVRTERLPIRIYATADGLAHNEVNRIVKDARGFLWFCTAEGLSRFDGYA